MATADGVLPAMQKLSPLLRKIATRNLRFPLLLYTHQHEQGESIMAEGAN